ncbi:alpha/beta hydrolase [Streptomyces sp. RLB3-17]|uniref:alpha/beta fold hydrolase n=1 Tax=unclassified Streptomyces TaxID=2593676 RepID=UPI00116368B5|nr:MULTISPECIES: alpha/beta hydrolase [unclassified Streptomyces]NMI55832.1 alpha/beta hydrolase [Streptomyces sp. RLA2-12]QDN55307.1 alpha/beta hydrolase [Streptomyces sp. S1D4-20]QDN65486.1 alpha/beta hydrolase [Streptomyces sp. S1D4-14]QDN96125.1 alpha/beta hydrolase [Streptomyces sp. RLB1-9]QDO06341.1 alpha/beta hydrolase [Streptomyces sp. S1D4-23]
MSTSDIALTAPNQFVEGANGVTYAYRRFGTASDDVLPLVMLQHFRGNLDNWDPLLLGSLAAHREIIPVDNAGVGLSTGTVPSTITGMARDAITFIEALGLSRIDLFGFSIGGMVAQELTLIRPQLVRRLVLAGTGPRSGVLMHGWINDVQALANVADNHPEDLLSLFFEVSPTSQQKGREFLERRASRTEDRDKPAGLQARDAQMDAITEWGIPDPSQLDRLAGITQPVLVANGDNDIMIPTPNTWLLAQHLPNARVRIYPDSGHGFLWQWPEEFAALIHSFLSGAGEEKAP